MQQANGPKFLKTRGNDLRVPVNRRQQPTSRSVGEVVIVANLRLEALEPEILSDWSTAYTSSEPGDVESVRLSDRLGQNSDVMPIENAISEWAAAEDMADVFRDARVTRLVCQGARFHSDALNFPDKAFCVVWLSPWSGLDLLFPNIDVRIQLRHGTTVLFDPAQPHGVVIEGASQWNSDAYYRKIPDPTQHFVSFDLDILHDRLVQRFALKLKPECASMDCRDVRKGKQVVKVDEVVGMWRQPEKQGHEATRIQAV